MIEQTRQKECDILSMYLGMCLTVEKSPRDDESNVNILMGLWNIHVEVSIDVFNTES